MLIGNSKGLPGEFILLFTILIWLLFFLVYLGNRHSKLNRWCFISGMCFSMGVLKEYLYFTLFPVLCQEYPWLMNDALSLNIYSLLTAVMYYYAMPSAIIFASISAPLTSAIHGVFSGCVSVYSYQPYCSASVIHIYRPAITSCMITYTM